MTTQEAFTPTVEGDDALVEIMARAIAATRHDNHFPLLPWDFYAPEARAALNALREHGKENT
jgi:hypothetical protein